MNSPADIAIVSLGRFHVADLARELSRNGWRVRFYSDVPPWRLAKFGVPRASCVTIWTVTICTAIGRVIARLRRRPPEHSRLKVLLFDRLVSWRLRRCTIVIGMSGMTLHCLKKARDKFHCQVWLERGSRHIASQAAILAENPSPKASAQVTPFALARELQGYELADRIVVPAAHVAESFIAAGVPPAKLFCNPYGVQLELFPWLPVKPELPATVIMVGNWSYQKGCDLLTTAVNELPTTQFLHVGPVGDLALPKTANFCHVDAVDVTRLSGFYQSAHLMVLPSRQEGLSLVQAQALASGLTLLCSGYTGGADLRELLAEPQRVHVLSPDRLAHLSEEISAFIPLSLQLRQTQPDLAALAASLSWESYGTRYSNALKQSMARASSPSVA